MKKLQFIFLFILIYASNAQEYFPKNNDIKGSEKGFTAFTNATIYKSPTQIIQTGTLLIKDTKIVAVGSQVVIPKNTKIIDLKGLYIYASFIDLYSDFGIQKPKRDNSQFPKQRWNSKRDGYYWNDHMRPEVNAFEHFEYNEKEAKSLLKLGYGTINTHVADGIARGTSLLICLNKSALFNESIISQKAAQHFGFTRSVTSKQRYPSSLMGMMALLRQYYNDVDWYKNQQDITDITLQAQIDNKNLPAIFNAADKLNDLRIDKISDQFNLNYIIIGGGNEFERIKEIKATNERYIIPLNFPKPYDVSNPYAADKIALSDLRFWNQAPSNPAVLAKNNIDFCLTASRLKDISAFRPNLLKAINYGLDKTTVLAALTTNPARYLGKENEIGTLKKGLYANFLITSKPIFDKGAIIYENWTQGYKNIIEDRHIIQLSGDYKFSIQNESYSLKLNGKASKLKAKLLRLSDSTKVSSKISYKNNWFNLIFNPFDSTKTEFIRLISKVDDSKTFSGKVVLENGEASKFTAQLIAKTKPSKKDSKKIKKTPETLPVSFPNMAYGFLEKPTQRDIIIKNVTVWTNEKEGVLKHKDVVIRKGKIQKIVDSGKLQVNDGFIEIDGTGKHLTSGIIDEHSHIAISRGVNEGGQNNSAEVTIQDVVRSNDINIYRNLAGGVTMSQLLHGSANPIGGRAALIKLKWGENPDDMQIKNHKFIKFALGENVKHSRTPYNSRRFPQTRMGVEQVYIDNFTRAKAYDLKKKKGESVRFDEELEVLAEILNKERFITCHSYIQSEITMLMRVAEKFDFKVNTFTHILEGYKVADKMKKHGVGASTFSDWWAYKYEVNDAIPYNGAILHNQGITVAFNSDDAEMSRRLNQEAAKAVKYGGVSEEEAWKFVTLNPAKLLHIDDRVGSLKKGKDADVVLWSQNPLSIYAKAEKTIIDGVIYFDIDRDKQQQKAIKKERNKLITMMLKAKNKGVKTQAPKQKKEKVYTCESSEL
jgi:imidazolonepropionase-like amidohydrolase